MNRELPRRFVEKPWGRDRLPQHFAGPVGRRIGEIWFEPPDELSTLLVKYLFTSERVSVQAHPTDLQVQARGLGRRGKDECWLVLATEEGAELGIGFDRHLEPGTIRAAALDGSIEEMLVWRTVVPGDFFYIPANTVHAIGAGVTLLEIQQNSDVTYRLYDYGRQRELHLQEGVPIARGERYPLHLHQHLQNHGNVALVEGPYFRMDRVIGSIPEETARRYAGSPVLALPLSGVISVGGARISAGNCGVASEIDEVSCSADAHYVLAQAT